MEQTSFVLGARDMVVFVGHRGGQVIPACDVIDYVTVGVPRMRRGGWRGHVFPVDRRHAPVFVALLQSIFSIKVSLSAPRVGSGQVSK